MCACRKGHVESVATLIRLGANVNSKEKTGFTPLAHAAKNGREEIVLKLLEAGAEKSERLETNGETPYCLLVDGDAVSQTFLNAERVGCSKQQDTVCFISRLRTDTQESNTASKREVDASVQDCRGYTPLMIASERGNVSILDHLLRCKTGYKSRNVVSDKGSTPSSCLQDGTHGRGEDIDQSECKVGLQNRFGIHHLQLHVSTVV